MAVSDTARRWLIGIVMIFLIIAFALPAWFTGPVGRQQGRGAPIGTVFGNVTLTNEDLRWAESHFVDLRDLRIRDPRLGEARLPLLYRLVLGSTRNYRSDFDLTLAVRLADQLLGPLVQDMDLLAILKREAEHAGVTVSQDRLQSVLVNEVEFPAGLTVEEENRMRRAVYDLLRIEALLEARAAAVKVTRPEVQFQLAQSIQALQLGVVVFDDEAERGQVTAASETRMAELFDRFASVFPGRPSPDNPFGFGYRQGESVRLEYIAIERGEALRVARASRTEHDWEVAARRYYTQNQGEFTRIETVQPDGLTLQAGPETRQVTRPFEEVRSEILDRLHARQADTLTTTVSRRISSLLGADYQSFRSAVERNAAPPPSSVGPGFNSFAYLRAVAEKIQRDTGLLPTVTTFSERFLDLAALSDLEGLGEAVRQEAGPGGVRAQFPQYVLAHSRPLAEAAGRTVGRRSTAVLYELFEPFPKFQNLQGSVFMVRVTETRAPRVPPREEVSEQLAQDAITAEAHDRGVAAAQHFLMTLSGPAAGMTLEAAALSQGRSYIPIANLTARTPLPRGLTLSSAGMRQFYAAAFALLRSEEPSPRAVVPVPSDRKVLVLELRDVRPLVTGIDPGVLEINARSGILRERQLQFIAGYLTPEAIRQRTGFVPDPSRVRPADPDVPG